MTIPVWPADLPQYALVEGFQSSPRAGRLKTGMDVGPGKQRSRGARLKPVTYAIWAEPNELARFYRFWEEEVNGGVTPFLMRDHQFDGLELSTEAGLGLLTEGDVSLLIESWWLVQFGQTEPVDTPVAPLLWRIQFDLVVLP